MRGVGARLSQARTALRGFARRRLRRAWLAAVVTLVGAAQPAGAYDVMLDVSGSMAGFAQFPAWTRMLDELDSGAERKWVFGEGTRAFNAALRQARLNDQTTKLGSALDTWVNSAGTGDTLVMVTDNVADEGEFAAEQQQQFYDLLQNTPSLAHIAVVPLRLPFDGEVYHPTDARIEADFRGDRALAVYVIAQTGYSEAKIDRLQRTLTRIGGTSEWPYIVIRPFAQTGWGESIRGTDLKIAGEGPRGAEIRTDADWIAITGYTVGDPLDFTIQATVQPGPNFRLRQADMDTEISFEGASYMRGAELDSVQISPPKKDLVPGEPAQFTLRYKIDGFQLFDLGFWRLLDLALEGSSWHRGEIAITVGVERENVDLYGPIERWNYSGPVDRLASEDATVQGQIYRFDSLLQGMIPPEELREQVVWSSPVWVQVVYPMGPLLFAILVILLVLAALVMLMRYLAKGARYEVEDEAGDLTEVAPSFASTATVSSNDGTTALTIQNFGLFHLHRSSGRLRSSPIADASRAVAHVETAGSDSEPPARYRFVVSKVKPKKERQQDDDDTL
jgi:hypothetical protein